MTKDTIESAIKERKIDYIVAEKVMGYQRFTVPKDGADGVVVLIPPGKRDRYAPPITDATFGTYVPAYSSHSDCIDQVIDKVSLTHDLTIRPTLNKDGGRTWVCQAFDRKLRIHCTVSSYSMCMAICEAAIAAHTTKQVTDRDALAKDAVKKVIGDDNRNCTGHGSVPRSAGAAMPNG